MRRRDVEMLSIAGVQELGSFWEILLQPQVFAMLSLRYGGTETVNRSRRVHDKIANGQCIVIIREAYRAIGGHASVRGDVAEDLMLAQRLFAAHRPQAIVLGVAQLSTRMYTSLGEVMRGWRKNIFAGGAGALPDIAIVRWLFPLLLLLFPASQLLPPLVLLAAGPWLGPRAVAWAVVATTTSLVAWMILYRRIGRPIWYALLYPIGAAVLAWIVLGAIARGRRVAWKGRQYRIA
jgi:chlorobactene glucosyltransferase